MKNSLKIIISVGILGALVFTIPGLAQDTPPANPPADTGTAAAGAPESPKASDKPNTCIQRLNPIIEEKSAELGQFINQHFQNERKNSELLPVAIDKFREHAKSLRSSIDTYFPREKAVSAEALEERTACQHFIDDALFVEKEILRKHMVATAHAKKTTRLLDAYKEINSKLDKLNFDMAQMYGYMEVFQSKLPCYVAQCN